MAGQRAAGAVQRGDPPIARLLRPIQEFIHNSAASGSVLMMATVLALIIANSPLAAAYDALLHTYMALVRRRGRAYSDRIKDVSRMIGAALQR